MEQRPLLDPSFEPQAEPRLEAVPIELGLEEEDDDEFVAVPQALEQTQDPLKLYVRQIGSGGLLTRSEERELAKRKVEGD